MVWSGLCIALYELDFNSLWPCFALSWASTASSDATLSFLHGFEQSFSEGWAIALVAVRSVRIITLVCMILYTTCIFARYDSIKLGKLTGHGFGEDETQGLLTPTEDPESLQSSNVNGSNYGTLNESSVEAGGDEDGKDKENDDDMEIKDLQQKRIEEQGGWLGYLKGFRIFLPYLLPFKDRWTQFWLLMLLLCLGAERVLTVMIPRQLGIITDTLAKSGSHANPGAPSVTISVSLSDTNLWKQMAMYALLQMVVSDVVSIVKDLAGTRVTQFSYVQLKQVSFAHVMGLSMDYHTSKSSGCLIKAIEQGTDLTYMVNSVFTTGPMLIDLAVAVLYLSSEFDFYMGFIVLATSLAYCYATRITVAMLAPLRRDNNEKSRYENEILYDSIANWPTVAYHNRKEYEQDRYNQAVLDHNRTRIRMFDRGNYWYEFQGLAMDIGFFVAASLAAYRVNQGVSDLSKFVFLLSYWRSIKGPMYQLSQLLQETTSHLINAEWLFQLLLMKPSVSDKPEAYDIDITEGRVEYRDVCFSYDPQRPILKDLSFVAKPNQSIALVGETGGGKSTVLKLLYRFYDVESGSITIDGHDLRDVTLDSLRDSLGAVPQDPSVFDQSILENIRYARPEATDEEIYAACKAARVHDQILKFPAAYKTKLGERGVRLSGGELQRIAIARVLLRQPKIVILDEATSAVDSQTESSVQEALKILGAGRTVFIVAHRLSTIVKADMILVIDQGSIVERGSHHELLQMGGRYQTLWNMQTAGHVVEASH